MKSLAARYKRMPEEVKGISFVQRQSEETVTMFAKVRQARLFILVIARI